MFEISRRSVLGIVALLAASILVAQPPAPAGAATTYVVDTTSYLSSLDACTSAPGDCSLQGAINAANAHPGADVIHFDIPAGECPGGVCPLQVVADVMTITEAVDIDASTQPQNDAPQANVCATDSAPSYMRVEIVIDAGIDGSIFAIDHDTGATRIRGFAFGTELNRGEAVMVSSGSGHRIECNHIALDAAGAGSLGTGEFYTGIDLGPLTSDVVVGTNGDGSDDIGERNVFGSDTGPMVLDVSGSEDAVVAGNYFGFTADGDTALGSETLTIHYDSVGARIGSNGDGVSDNAEGNHFCCGTSVLVDGSGMDADDVLIAGNTFGLTPAGDPVRTDVGVLIQRLTASTTGVEVRDNTFGWVTTGIRLDNSTGGVTVSGNRFGGQDGGVTYGGQVAISVGGGASHVISDNLIRNSELYGIAVVDSGSLAAGSRDNCLVGNTTGVTNFSGDGVLFENNWWGDMSGPSLLGPGTGDPVGELVDYEPWLTAPPQQCNTPPRVDPANFTVPEDATVGTVVGSLYADDDGDDITFGIEDGNTGGAFAIDEATGQITVASALDYESTPSYLLAVTVADPFIAALTSVAVLVTDVDDDPRFIDVPFTHTFYADIEWLAAEGITRGCNPPTNDLFCPDASVTRGQMAAFLHRALGGVLTPGPLPGFTDIDGSVFDADIEWLGSVGVTQGCNPPVNDMYCPLDVVTRGQMAAFLVRALGYSDDGGGDLFVDDDGSVFESAIDKLATAGVTRGCNPPINDKFCPNDAVTRGQMAAFLHRALGD
jgi:hypothetical protein